MQRDGEVVIEYGAVPNKREGHGFLPLIWENGHQRGDTYASRGYDKDEATRMAEKEANDRAAKFRGDWKITVRRRSSGRSSGVDHAAVVAAAISKQDRYYKARVRREPHWDTVFVEQPVTGHAIGHVMIVKNPAAPGGFVWSTYGHYASNVRRVLIDAGFGASESPRNARSGGRASRGRSAGRAPEMIYGVSDDMGRKYYSGSDPLLARNAFMRGIDTVDGLRLSVVSPRGGYRSLTVERYHKSPKSLGNLLAWTGTSAGRSGGVAPNVLALYKTRTGKTAMEVKRIGSGYSYTGEYGAGSGGNLSEVKKRVASALRGRRGLQIVFESPEYMSA